jgi:hypothetical protein
MRINTLETNRKRTLACMGAFLIGLGLYMGSQGRIPLILGIIATGIYAIDMVLEERDK